MAKNMITLTIMERFFIQTVLVILSMILGIFTRKLFSDWINWFKHNYILKWCHEIIEKGEKREARKRQQNQNLEEPCEWEILASGKIIYEELDVEPDAVIQAKGVTVEEITDLKDIMQGKSNTSDMDSAIVVAKMTGTVIFDELQEQIKGAKQNLSSLIDRVDQKLQNKKGYKESLDEYFYENTGFSIKDFLPQKTA